MISNNFKLIIFSIILGILTLIYNKDCDGLYKNINYKNIVLMQTTFRSLGELSYESRTNHIHGNNNLTKYGHINEKKYKKNKYLKDHAKRKYKISEVTEKENISRNLEKHKRGSYDEQKEAKLNGSSHSLKYLEMQRKLYNHFYVQSEMHFEKLSDKTNDNFFEFAYKKKSCNQLSSSNKVHDNYLYNLKECCVGGAEICAFSSEFLSIITGTAHDLAGNVPSVLSLPTFNPYGILALVLILIVFAIIILYIWLYRRRKNSWKHECKKHICT